MKGDRKRTPILNREVEARARGSSEVIPYRLSEEELEKYRAMPVPTDQKRPRVNLPSDEPTTISPEKQRERAQKSHENRAALEPAKEEFLREIAKGKTIADIERERGMSKNSLYYWVKKWDLIGINPGKVRQLLSEEDETMGKTLTKEIYLQHRLDGMNRTAIMKEYFDGNINQFYTLLKSWGIKEKEAEERALELLQAVKQGAVRPEPAVPDPKPVQAEPASEHPVTAAEEIKVADPMEEIARLNKELERLKANNVEAVRLSGSASEKQQAEIQQLRIEIERLNTEHGEEIRRWLKFEKELYKEKDSLREEIKLLKDDCRELSGDVIAKEREIANMADQLEKLQTKPVSFNGDDQQGNDPVNHPAHYTAGGIECIDAIESATTGLTGGLAYNTGAAIKYLWRWSLKNGVEDLHKARWYVDRIIEMVTRGKAG